MSDRARRWAASLSNPPGVVAAVAVGSVACGDFNKCSDTNMLLVGDDLPARWSSSGGPQSRGAG
jgi:predicted nucleotidyltransferase